MEVKTRKKEEKNAREGQYYGAKTVKRKQGKKIEMDRKCISGSTEMTEGGSITEGIKKAETLY